MVNTEIRLIILFAAKDEAALYSQQKTRPGADCGSDYELLIAKFRLKLKKVGKITRPVRYDLNQRPYSYTVEVTNRFKGLDLIERLDLVDQNNPKEKRNPRRQSGCLRRLYK